MPADRALIVVRVPATASVWFENTPTTRLGSERRFLSPALEPGKTHILTVKARWAGADGKDANWDLPIRVRAGDVMTVDLTHVR